MQYVFLICLSAGCKNTYCIGKRPFLLLLLIYVRFLTIFYAETMGLSFIADVVRHYDSERVCRWGVFLNSVRPMRSTPFNAFPFWVIFCHITLEHSWVIGFCLHFVECTLQWQSPIANRVLYKHQCKLIDVSDCRVMIFLTTILERHQWLTLNWYH